MGGHSSLTFEEVAEVLRNARGRIGYVVTIANRLKRGTSIVQRAVDHMHRLGMVEEVPTHRGTAYRLPEGVSVSGSIKPLRAAPVEPVEIAEDFETLEGEGDGEDDGGDDSTPEQQQAAVIWKRRMGERRYHDDPRALREQGQQIHLIPPFYNLARRDV